MAEAKTEPLYRLVVFDELDEPAEVRDLVCKVTGMHPTEAMVWVAKMPGTWPRPMPEALTRTLLDGLYDLGVAAEAWAVDRFPDLGTPRTIHEAACLPEGFRVNGLRGEPTHWVPWPKVEMVCAGRIDADDEYRSPGAPRWPSAVVTGIRAIALRKPEPASRKSRATRVPRDPVGEVLIVRKDPRLTFRVVENQMNYAYLGEALSPSAAANFPKFVADLCARAEDAYLAPSTRALLQGGDRDEYTFGSPQSLLDYATHRLLWSWYRRDRDKDLDRPRLDDTQADDEG
jgi:hypothetical protein